MEKQIDILKTKIEGLKNRLIPRNRVCHKTPDDRLYNEKIQRQIDQLLQEINQLKRCGSNTYEPNDSINPVIC